MRKIIQRCLVATAVLASMCGSVAAEEAVMGGSAAPDEAVKTAPVVAEKPAKDWYVALRLGYQPYQLHVSGNVQGRNFDRSASLSDIMNKSNTTIFGGELEYGMGKWFTSFAGFYQKSEVNKSNGISGADVSLKELGLNPIVGYRVLGTSIAGDMPLSVDLTGGLFYVNVKGEISLYNPTLGNISGHREINFTDPMLGARAYLALTKKLGLAAAGQIGGFGVGSEFNTTAAGNVVYNFTNWLALSGGYKIWYFKYENSNKPLNRLEQTLQGPVVGLQLKY
jgi:hypothetical protein